MNTESEIQSTMKMIINKGDDETYFETVDLWINNSL